MLFASVQYLIFLPATVAVYWAAPRRLRNLLLLIASYVFYMSFIPIYGALIFALAVTNYLIGTWIPRSRRPALVLALGVTIDLGVLAYFKYTNFAIATANEVIRHLDWPTLNIILPLGISFFTFEFVHYLVDIRRGSVPIHDFTNFHLFASFFPSQISGPIKRFQPFNAQLRPQPSFDPILFDEGVWLIIRGLAKKLVFADHLGPIVAMAFAPGPPPDQLSAWVGAWTFAFQIYFDFSGYTDIGRGSAQLLGFRLPENFAQPYFAVGLTDFWRRWHMSLSSWLRDYLYIPLGGNRRGRVRTLANLIVTMGLGGLWHGAAFHFVIWGLFHGVGLAFERLTRATGPLAALAPPFRGVVGRAFLMIVTFNVVCVGWVLFRAPDFSTAGDYVGAMFGGSGSVSVPIGPVAFVATLYLLAVLAERLIPTVFGPRVGSRTWALRGVLYAAIITATIVLLPQTIERFIYFQF